MKSPVASFHQAYLLNWHYSAANLNILLEKHGNKLKLPEFGNEQGCFLTGKLRNWEKAEVNRLLREYWKANTELFTVGERFNILLIERNHPRFLNKVSSLQCRRRETVI